MEKSKKDHDDQGIDCQIIEIADFLLFLNKLILL
jgi:hypothetical protein